jgi:hypothetical protein
VRIYLAARYSRHRELEACASDLRFDGHEVTSRWHKGKHQALDEDLTNDPSLARRFAEDDLADLLRAEMIISFTEIPRSGGTRGGRHFEAGYAYMAGLDTWIVGPHENVFHHLPGVVRFETWPAAVKTLREARGISEGAGL